MRTIIAGSRDTQMAVHKVYQALKYCPWPVTEIIAGGGGNVDHAAEYVASCQNLPFTLITADWNNGRKAGPMRNRKMAEQADCLIAIWDGKSRGTKNMIDEAKKRGLQVYLHLLGIPEELRNL